MWILIGYISLYIPFCVFAAALVLANSSQLTDPKQQAVAVFVVRAARELKYNYKYINLFFIGFKKLT